MKIWQAEDLFFKHFDIENTYTGQHIKDLKYLQLAALILEYGSVKNFKEKILFQCIEYKDEIKEQVNKIFCRGNKSYKK